MDNAKKTVVALGMFDGVHIGHKKLIDTAVLIAKARGLVPAVYTFSNHPQELLGHSVNRLCSNEDRVKYMTALGIKLVDMVEFTKQIRSLPPKEFIDMLAERLNPAVIVAGYNYTFGMKKAGDTAMLEKLATARNIDAAVIPPVLANKKPVSSTRIRELIERGDVQQAQLLLGRTHNITGTAPCRVTQTSSASNAALPFFSLPMGRISALPIPKIHSARLPYGSKKGILN